MSGPPIFLTVDHVLAIHRRMIDEFGGDPGMLDPGLLESAVAMPAARFGGEWLHQGTPAMAAACLFHICKNHPFLDGNKRTAVAAAEVFVRLNGLELSASDEDLYRLTMGVAKGEVSKDEVIEFFEKRVR